MTMDAFNNVTKLGSLNFTGVGLPEWTLSASLSMFATASGSLLNLIVLAIFLTHPNLSNAFTVYVVNLLIIDLILAVAHGPLNVTEKLYPSWFLGLLVCKLYNYLSYTFQSLINFAHCLIAFNRVWAVSYPFSYRSLHKPKLGILLCASFWIVVHTCQIPTALLTSVIRPVSDNSSLLLCSVEPENVGVWSSISEVCLYILPLSFVIISYPVVCYRSFPSQLPRKHQVKPAVVVHFLQHGFSTVGSTRPEAANGTIANKNVLFYGRKIHGGRTGFVILTLMTLSALVCLVPNESYFTWVMLTSNDSYSIYLVVDALQRLTSVIDPLLIVMGNAQLRRTILQKFRIIRTEIIESGARHK